MKKTKVLIILPAYALGGAEKVMFTYFEHFKSSSISLKMLIINKKYFPTAMKNKNIMKLCYSRFIYAVPEVLKIIKKNRFDILFSTFPNISAILLVLKYFGIINSKILIRQPNMINKSLNGSFKLFLLRNTYKYFIKIANAVIVTSLHMEEEAIKNKVKKEKLFLVRNPIDVAKTRKNVKPIKTDSDKINLVFVGRLVYQKGIDRILKIFENYNHLNLTVIGDGDCKHELSKKSEQLGIINKVIFKGKKIRPFNFVAGADYFILPSRWEGLPNIVLESLALGTPVVSTKDVQSLLDFKKNISNKSIIIFENIEELIIRISKLKKRKDYRNPKLRSSLLINHTSPGTFNVEVNNIILKIA